MPDVVSCCGPAHVGAASLVPRAGFSSLRMLRRPCGCILLPMGLGLGTLWRRSSAKSWARRAGFLPARPQCWPRQFCKRRGDVDERMPIDSNLLGDLPGMPAGNPSWLALSLSAPCIQLHRRRCHSRRRAAFLAGAGAQFCCPNYGFCTAGTYCAGGSSSLEGG